MKICSICKKISATDEDHLDCIEMRRIKLEAEDFKESIPDRLSIGKSDDIHTDIKGILDHLSRKKERS